jgi:hypothetical protein
MNIKLQSEEKTEIFINSRGGVSIKQTDQNGEESCVVFNSRKRALETAAALRKIAMGCSFYFEEAEEDEEA